MEVKAGYKQTEVGVIPEDWELRPLGSIGSWFSGGTPTMTTAAYWSGDIPWVSPKDMKTPRLYDSIDHVTSKAVTDGLRLLPAGAILLVIRGMILAHSFPVARAERALAFNQDIKAVVAGDGIDSWFLLYWLSANARRLRGLTTESTHGTKRLPTEMLFRELVACPSTPEQKAITEALSDSDALIESLEQLLVKKRQIKKGAMRELLTGNTRLPGFDVKHGFKKTSLGLIPKDWEVSAVGEEFTIQLGKMLDFDKNVGVPKPFLGNRAVQWGRVDAADIGTIKLTPADLHRFRLREGDLLVCEGGEVGRCAIWSEPIEECYYQKALHRLRPKRGYNQVLMLNVLWRLASTGFLLNFVTQTSIAHLSKDKFEVVPIPRPPNSSEQAEIASVFSDMDAEIDTLEEKLSKARQLKQGMMQELLTGRIRLT